MKNTCTSLLFASMFAVSLFSDPVAAHAALYLDYQFASNQSGGLVYFDPSKDSLLHGSNISVVSLYGNETPLHSGTTLAIQNGLLNFTTGGLIDTSTSGNTKIWNFGTPGTITLKGKISGLDINSDSNLLTGTFLSATATQFDYGFFKFNLIFSSLGGENHQLVNNYFSVLPGTNPDTMTMTFYAQAIGSGGFASTNIVSGNITDNPAPIPIPAAFWLLGSGLIGLVGVRRIPLVMTASRG